MCCLISPFLKRPLKFRKSLLLVLIFILFTQIGYSQQITVSQLVKQLNESFIAKSHVPLKQSLAPDFSVGTSSLPTAAAALDRVFQQYAFDSLYCEQPALKDRRVILTFYNRKQKDTLQSAMYLDEEGKIRRIDLFDRMFGVQREEKAKLLVSVPFEQIGGSIILHVKVNNFPRPLRLLFDTGADGMALPQSLADSIGLKVARTQQTKVVGGDMTVQVSTGNTVYLDDFAIDNQGIAIFKSVRPDLDGIIGNTLAKRFIVNVDYDQQRFSLYTFGAYSYADNGISVPVSIPNRNIELKADLKLTESTAPVEGSYFFDTGADYNMIGFPPFVTKVRTASTGFKPDFVGTTHSMGMVTPTFNGNVNLFSLSKAIQLREMPVALMAQTAENQNWQPGAAGSIGIKLISRYNFTLNLADQEIHLTPNKRHQHPFDFVLANHLLGFKDNGELYVITPVGPSATRSALTAGSQILKINSKNPKDLFQNATEISKLKEGSLKGYKIKYLKNGKQETITLGL